MLLDGSCHELDVYAEKGGDGGENGGVLCRELAKDVVGVEHGHHRPRDPMSSVCLCGRLYLRVRVGEEEVGFAANQGTLC